MFVSVLVTIALLNFAAGSPAVTSPSEEQTTRFSSLGLRFSTDDSIVHSSIDDVKLAVANPDTECQNNCGVPQGGDTALDCNFNKEDGAVCSCKASGAVFVSKDDGCKVPEPECDIEYCEETRGKCVSTDGSVHCSCPGEMVFVEGKGCTILTDKCYDLKPECLNSGGECILDDDEKLQCKCSGSKKYKEKEGCTDLCDNYFCENAGVCILSNGAPKCFCLVPFHGDRCELVVEDPCRNSTFFCENDGKCVLVNGGQVPVCLCPSPFYGERCELGGKDKSDKYLYSLIWVLCSAIILSILVNCCLIVTRCRKNGGS